MPGSAKVALRQVLRTLSFVRQRVNVGLEKCDGRADYQHLRAMLRVDEASDSARLGEKAGITQRIGGRKPNSPSHARTPRLAPGRAAVFPRKQDREASIPMWSGQCKFKTASYYIYYVCCPRRLFSFATTDSNHEL